MDSVKYKAPDTDGKFDEQEFEFCCSYYESENLLGFDFVMRYTHHEDKFKQIVSNISVEDAKELCRMIARNVAKAESGTDFVHEIEGMIEI